VSRSLALLPFEISRQAPDPLPVLEAREEDEAFFDEFGDEEFDEELDDDEQQEADEQALAVEALTQEAEALAATEGDVEESEQEIAAEGPGSGGAPLSGDGSGAGEASAPDDAADAGRNSENFEASETSEGMGAGDTDAAGDGSGGAATDGDEQGRVEGEERFEEEDLEGQELEGQEQLEEQGRDAEVEGQLESESDSGAEVDATGDEQHVWLARADRLALARWIREELAAILMATGAVAPAFVELEDDAESEELDDLELALTPESIAVTLEQAHAELGLACRLRADAELVELSGLLADADGEERVRFTLAAQLGDAHKLPRQMARELLLALGDDAAAAAIPEPTELEDEEAELPVAAEAMLELARGARSLAEAGAAPAGSPLADPTPGLRELLEALTLSPTLLGARDRIVRGALEAVGSESMPAWLSGLEQLVVLRPGDCQALLVLAEYRRLHHDQEGARDLLLRARDLAAEGHEEATVLAALARLVEEQGRHEEAVQHLRAAVRVDDDPALYLRLGQLLQERDPEESSRSLQRAVVLSPESAGLRLELARQLTRIGETARAAIEAAQAARLGQGEPEIAQAADDLLRALIDAAQLQPD
jgi:tetratricopeptide (TPR) repeat protein